MILDGAMIVLAIGFLTALHPVFVMGRDTWTAADWNGGGQGGAKDHARERNMVEEEDASSKRRSVSLPVEGPCFGSYWMLRVVGLVLL
jgi:hypothetical protein